MPIPDKNKIASLINETAKVALTVGSLQVPLLGAVALAPDYIFKFLSSRGILDSKIDRKLRQQINSVITNTIDKTRKEISTGNYRELVSRINDKLNHKLNKLDVTGMSLDMLESVFEEMFNDKSLWDENYFSRQDIGNIANTFYSVFLSDIMNYQELRECVQMASLESLTNGLCSLGTKVERLESEVEQLKRKLEDVRIENNDFVITVSQTANSKYIMNKPIKDAISRYIINMCEYFLLFVTKKPYNYKNIGGSIGSILNYENGVMSVKNEIDKYVTNKFNKEPIRMLIISTSNINKVLNNENPDDSIINYYEFCEHFKTHVKKRDRRHKEKLQ